MIQLEIVHNSLVYLQNIVNINIHKVMNVRLNVITSYKIIQNNVLINVKTKMYNIFKMIREYV